VTYVKNGELYFGCHNLTVAFGIIPLRHKNTIKMLFSSIPVASLKKEYILTESHNESFLRGFVFLDLRGKVIRKLLML
jgi:hypothetical protein